MTTRKYSSRAQQTTLSSSITSGDVTMTVGSGANLMGGKTPAVGETYTVVIDPDTALEEIVDISNYASGNTLTIARGIDGSSDVTHSPGAIVRHMIIGRDLQDSNDHSVGTLAGHAATTSAQLNTVISDNTGSGALVFGTSPTITSPSITTPTITSPTITGTGTITATTFTGDLTGTVTGSASLNLLKTGGTMSGAIAMGSSKITGLGTPTANTTDAATTAYVDTAISDLIAGAPSTLNTLDEIAAALNDTANFSDTVVLKTGSTMSGALAMGTNKITGLGTPTVSTDAATKAYADSIVATAPGNLTGPITSVGAATSIAAQTGTGTTFVVNTSPTLVTPVLGVATATSINKVAVTAPATSATLTLANNSSLITSGGFSTTLTSSATTAVTLPTTGTLATLAGTETLTAKTLISPTIHGIYLPATHGISYEGTTDDAFETLVTVVDPTADRTISLPDATDTLVGKATTDTLTNKTLTTPVMTNPKITLTYSAKTAAYTAVSGDEGGVFSMNNASTIQFNIPTDATFNFAVGTQFNVFWLTGAGQPTIGAVTPGTTTVISTGATSATPKLRVANSMATALKIAANSWIVTGDIS